MNRELDEGKFFETLHISLSTGCPLIIKFSLHSIYSCSATTYQVKRIRNLISKKGRDNLYVYPSTHHTGNIGRDYHGSAKPAGLRVG